MGWLDERRGAINSGLKEWAGERWDMYAFYFLSHFTPPLPSIFRLVLLACWKREDD